MTSQSLRQRALSRTKLELLLECPRCFYDDVALGIRRPRSPPFTLNNAVDRLLKAEFDRYRAAGEPHPMFAGVGLDAVPLAHADLDAWRHNFTGVRHLDAATGWTYFGALDDVWRARDGRLIVADYKATARRDEVTEAGLYGGYRRQVEVYQYLLARNGFEVDETAWFVYANGIPDAAGFDDRLAFRTTMLPHRGRTDWVEAKFREAVAVATAPAPPPPNDDCDWCQYVVDRVEVARR